MASSTSPEANEIRRRGRRRLIGAIAIAIALVVFVPMILDPEPRRPRNEPVLEIPSKENATPLPPPAASTPPAKASPAPSAPAKAPAQPQAAAAPKLEGFAVQVGAFKDEEKLKQAREKLSAAGIAHYIERRDSPSGTLTRLRAGPFPTREGAEKALAAIKAAALDGQVVPLP
jgi:DedD protein